jgi:plasmid stability protein
MRETPPKRATIYFDALLHRALRLKAAATERSISDLVNDAVKVALAEDASDFEAFEAREAEVDYSFEDVVRDLKRRGKI